MRRPGTPLAAPRFRVPGVLWGRVTGHELVECVVMVPEGESAELIHTDEHGRTRWAPVRTSCGGKREEADAIRRVADQMTTTTTEGRVSRAQRDRGRRSRAGRAEP